MSTRVESARRLPAGIIRLLECFARAHPEAVLRGWVRRDGDWSAILPGSPETPSPAPAAPTQTIDLADGRSIVVQVDGAVGDGVLEFFQAALQHAQAAEDEARSAAREISEKYEEINLLYSISEILGSVLRLEDAAERILAEVADVLGARRAFLWVHDAKARALVPAATVGEDARRAPIAVDDPDALTARVFRDCQPLNLEQGTLLPRDRGIEPRPHGAEALLSVPINYTPPEGETRTVGVITLVGRRSNVRFSAGDARLLSAIASQVGAALENQRLVQESLHRERLLRELELAHDLQLKLLPDTSTFDGAAQAAARCVPAESVGGDFYNLFRLADDRLGVIIGDVSSHGFSAALIMALTMSAVAIHARESEAPGEVLRQLHATLIHELETTEMYLTLFYGVLDPAAGRLVYSNAGHPHAFAVREDGSDERLAATSPPLGITRFHTYGEAETIWAPRDLLCLFTDGLSDAFLGTGRPGERAVLDEVKRRRGQPVRRILDGLFRLAARATSSAPPDDRTAVLLRV
jgi:sigma-B regulation protein RsbU (phosphoserine phosphatase)